MRSEWWDAPASPGPLRATVTLPGSKSESARALVLRYRFGDEVRLSGVLRSRDTELLSAALIPEVSEVDCGLAGTVMRFVPALKAFTPGTVRFDGDPHARKRPIRPLLTALTELGAHVTYLGEPGYLPFAITGATGELPSEVSLDSSQSSQYLSAILMAAPAPLTIHLVNSVPSLPHVDMTADMLRAQGVDVRRIDEHTWFTGGVAGNPGPIRVDPDLSNAGPFLAAALICGGTVSIPNWPTRTHQAGASWREILPRFGASVSLANGTLSVTASGHSWPGLDIDLGLVGELAPTVAALACLATTPSRLRGIGHLRGHETDRLAALATEIARCGGNCHETSDGLIISPGALHPADFDSYADHRMATFGALLGLALPGSRVSNIETVAKTLPDFVDRWNAMLRGEISPPVEELDCA